MLLKRNVLEDLTIISCGGALICIILNYVTNISPITGIWFHLYLISVFVISVLFSFKFIQWLLHLNKPIKYDLEGLVKKYPRLSFLTGILPRTERKIYKEPKEYDINELSIISTVLERKLVSSWYMAYISPEIGFPFACKQMLDQMISKTFQICEKVDTKDVYVDICAVLTSHLKEYSKALKRHEESPTSSVESLYKKTHPVSNDKKYESADHCVNLLRVVLKELIPWELWDTPQSEILVRVLSKKLDIFINSTLADPSWLNDKLLSMIKEKKEENTESPAPEECESKVIPEEIFTEINPLFCNVESPSDEISFQKGLEGVDEFQERMESIVEEKAMQSSEPMDIKSSPILRQRRGRQGKNEVKIYDRVIEGSMKTWETDMDLQCISLGQDLLASLDGEITLSRLWGQDVDPDGSPNPPRAKSPQPFWFGEEDAIELECGDSSPQKAEPSPVKKESSPKPAELLKDIQSTVHHAKSKIGDLQVPYTYIDVPRNRSSDEAAGMMEGLLDFGIAGIKKGLRFTGLSDDSQEKSPSHQAKEKASEKISPPQDMVRKPIQEHRDIASGYKEENGAVPHLVKQHRVTSQDSMVRRAGSWPPPEPGSESPEPEYEEAADLSTSIAKLRCLLQQRAETAHYRSEEIWWEGAEETRGRTQQHHSSRPIDTATLADEYDMNMERNSSPGQTSNNMQRLDKLFQRTVTGVFNSIKTAVGAEGAEGAAGEGAPRPRDWHYVCTSPDLSVGGAVARLVGARRALGQVDAALDPLQPPAAAPEPGVPPADFEEWCSSAGAGWSGACALAGAAGLCRSHVAFRLATLLFADLAESLLASWLDELGAWLHQQVFAVFQQLSGEELDLTSKNDQLRPLDIDETCAAIMAVIPEVYVFSEESMSAAVRLAVSSLGHQDLNKDLVFRTLDLLVARFKHAAGIISTSFDAN
ncbi:PREDICTED: uncharacterized protein LOC106107735 isoform X2 [Papilio polytes]|uniref:uncharacterized protein LOC106107735 isoform X2 n=1 Tax=Papilio polytes TaxID=76194 RepID=UPI0006768DBA|nr:PREDICTED: uncharacterized protein LOC106107735 isoform X2 [Papilio polytes]